MLALLRAGGARAARRACAQVQVMLGLSERARTRKWKETLAWTSGSLFPSRPSTQTKNGYSGGVSISMAAGIDADVGRVRCACARMRHRHFTKDSAAKALRKLMPNNPADPDPEGP